MPLRFSDRIGKTIPLTELLREGLRQELVNSIWNIVYIELDSYNNEFHFGPYETDRAKYFKKIWIRFLKQPFNTSLIGAGGMLNDVLAYSTLQDWFLNATWYEQLNFVEFIVSIEEDKNKAELISQFNDCFETEFSAYRFINGILTEVTSTSEIKEIEIALTQPDRFLFIKTHLESALRLLSDKKSPDYRNSIKESISAVESLCKILLQNEKTTLGQALKEVEQKMNLPKNLKAAFSALYGYTSDEAGIRHALTENDSKAGLEEARFMLITCSAFINYLIAKQAV